MKVTVLGGTGPTGRHVVDQCISLGFEVKALVRNPDKLPSSDERLEVVRGDATLSSNVANVIEEADAVISCLGTDSLGETTIYSESIVHITAGMKHHGVRRLICIGAVGQDPDRSAHMPFVGRLVISLFLKKTLADMYQMQKILEETDLDWTIMWPPRLNDGPLTGTYRTASDGALKKGSLISRTDLAHCMVNAIEDSRTYKSRVSIAY